MSKKLLKSTIVVSSMTFFSRITGMIRDMALAQVVGSSEVADAFFVAFRIPNFLRRIFGEGAFSAAFVPVYSKIEVAGDEGKRKAFLALMAGRFGMILLAITLIGVVAAPFLVMVIAPGFLGESEKYELTVSALRLTFPYLFFISLVAMAAGIFNSRNHFAVPAVTPVMLNLSLIAAVLWLVPIMANPAIALATGVFVAGAVQLIFQLPFLARERSLVWPRLRVGKSDKKPIEGEVNKVFRLMLPALFGVSVAQINMLINTLLASFLVTGSVSWLYYSDRLMEFPLGVFGIALATVILPTLSKQQADTSSSLFSDTLDWALRWVLLIVLPASVALMVLAGPLLTTIFQYGAFTPTDVTMASQSLVAFALGLIAFVVIKVLAPGFYARQDTRTPVRYAAIAMGVNAVLSLLLVWEFAHVGLALATSVAALVNAALLFFGLYRRGIYQPLPGWWSLLLKVAVASLVMGLVLWSGAGDTLSWIESSLLHRLGWLSWLIVVGLGVYMVSLLSLGVKPWKMMLVEKIGEEGD